MDIRRRRHILHQDVIGLNFIRKRCPFVFRKHFRQGLRSHLLQVLRPQDIQAESEGVLQNGIRLYPKAQPIFMFRLFKQHFNFIGALTQEINTYKMIQRWLPRRHYAVSSEFIVDYRRKKWNGILLCGLQEYVPGAILDPWSVDLKNHLRAHIPVAAVPEVCAVILSFVRHVKRMIAETGYVPDIAGYGNLLLTPQGQVKLVDINNIAPVARRPRIAVDDKGYPVCDKSIEALFRLEQGAGGGADKTDGLYRFFMCPARMKAVSTVEALWSSGATSKGRGFEKKCDSFHKGP